ncbi:MAG TPA: serine/threonine-protein kinase [Nannocystaceae bacterium]|nr:serine/threonine-protein kinase [Nannocystaceae bacterium]
MGHELVGTTLAGRYRVDALIGSGAMSIVLRCHDLAYERDVAIKLLHPELASSIDAQKRFAHEARSATRLHHANCVQVLDVGACKPDGRTEVTYICMELLDGVPLTRLLDKPLSTAFTLEVIGQILEGLGHAHSRGLVHRDVKPENVIVTGDAGRTVIKLVDFGVAKVLDGEGAQARLTRERRTCGTPGFMSPEQITGGTIDGRTDLYAVGILLYRMIAGHMPFESDDVRELMRMHVQDSPRPLSTRLGARLCMLVEWLMAKDREQRPLDAATARAEVERARADVLGLPRGERVIAAPTPSAAPMPERQRNPLGIVAWMVLLVLCFVGFAIASR